MSSVLKRFSLPDRTFTPVNIPNAFIPNIIFLSLFLGWKISQKADHGTYQEIFNELLSKGYDLKKIDLSHCFIDTKDIPAKKGETSV
ncbi:MAG: hypothetical protein ACOX79_12700, partial [Methanosarcina sp.]